MRLWSQRSERQDWLGRRIYRLSLAIEVTANERDLIGRHRLATADVWFSPTAQTLHSEAETAFEQSRGVRSWRLRGIAGTLAHIVDGFWLALQSRTEAHLSVGDLLSGFVLEAREVAELIATEAGVRAGVEALDVKLRHLASYDDGTETISETGTGDAGSHPATWIRMRAK